MAVKRKKDDSSRKLIVMILLVCLLLLFFVLVFLNNKDYYKIESRVNDIKDYAKKDKDYKTVGWLRVQGTNIDYPVIYGPAYNVDMKTDDFLWTEVDYEKLNDIVYISGHNILNLSSTPVIADKDHSRFEQLMSFTYEDFVKKNKYIQYTIDGENYLYKIYAVSYSSYTELNPYRDKNLNKKELEGYYKENIKNSIFDFDVDVDSNDKFITLHTCTRMIPNKSDAIFKVDARLVRDNEDVSNYDVVANGNYKKIQNYMKGGDVNEA